MKTTSLALFCLLAYGRSLSKHARHHPLIMRAGSNSKTCNYKCSLAVNGDISKSWNIRIVTNENNTALIDVAYDVTANIIVSINHMHTWGFAIDGDTGFIAWFDLKLGGVHIANVKNGTVILFRDSNVSHLSANGPANISAAISVFAKVVHDYKTLPFDINAGSLVAAVYKNPLADVSPFLGERYDEFLESFGEHFAATVVEINSGILTANDGIIGFILADFDGATPVGRRFVTFLDVFYANTDGTFGADFALIIYASLCVSGEDTEKLLMPFTYSIQAIGTLYANLSVAIAAYNSGEIITTVEKKTVPIGNANYDFTFVKFSGGSWVIDISHSNTNVLIGYYKDLNIFLFYNSKQQIAVVINGNYGLFAVWNMKTGKGLIVKYSGIAIVVVAKSGISTVFAAGYHARTAALINAQIERNRKFTSTTANAFSFVSLSDSLKVQTLEEATSNYSTPVKVVLIESFKGYIDVSRNSTTGVTCLVAGIFHDIGSGNSTLATAVGGLFTVIGNVGGTFSKYFSLSFFDVFVSSSISNGFSGLIKTISGTNYV